MNTLTHIDTHAHIVVHIVCNTLSVSVVVLSVYRRLEEAGAGEILFAACNDISYFILSVTCTAVHHTSVWNIQKYHLSSVLCVHCVHVYGHHAIHLTLV